MSEFIRRVMSGEDRSVKGVALRLATSMIEPGYAIVMRGRNAMYDWGMLRKKGLGRPVISVGNITTGGTGKTPMVRWLAERLGESGVAVLLRGYKGARDGKSDEEMLLAEGLGDKAIVEAGSSRADSGARVLAAKPGVKAFILDDGFQHRQVARDFDLVLVNAADPFGYERVLPRGMLREPLAGLKRADAVVVTRSDQVSRNVLEKIEERIRRCNPDVAIYHARHALVGLVSSRQGRRDLQELQTTRFFAFAGIGNPESFGEQLQELGDENFVGRHWFADHHDYSQRDLDDVVEEARQKNAGFLVTTEKDWVKISRLEAPAEMGIYRVEMEMRFAEGDEERLLGQILQAIGSG
ncbi:MAG TPA: tetraacyldisaccharide 4'-kinase [Tepidisphaeraceae bacterium]|jgi:tetraacyldisaccharide 4'-kinase|nr:tetraacyldisaccharide 4'-kinase [Tepidisphaeraceae bacterium]